MLLLCGSAAFRRADGCLAAAIVAPLGLGRQQGSAHSAKWGWLVHHVCYIGKPRMTHTNLGVAMNKMFQYEPYGPFKVPIERGTIPKNLTKFWNEVEKRKTGLSEAVGCYIFAVKKASAYKPCYVGKTVKLGFKGEGFQLHKRKHLASLGTLESGTVMLYLIPRVTSTGKFRGKYGRNIKQGQDGKITILEERLIGLALAKNPDLRNVKGKKQIQLPGIMNESKGRRSPEAEMLAALLGVGRTRSGGKASL